ncbi:hypothetical protein EMPS_00714 [Entomortierella parvispora]|uniref:F-box domain-containing protein n=1 Tax=Entomortierella parvispora TaxID=205924 RepID=A0A9P3H279_9FUNG|nr:hypothetical protein EMPS_00714 [Entomortierella parvispora]
MTSISSSVDKPIVHPLHIPEILKHIAIHLQKRDLASSCRVNKTWFEPFASLLWQTIPSQLFYTEGFAEACFQYKHFIRDLSWSRSGTTLDLLMQMTRLKSLVLPYVRSEGPLYSVIEANKQTLQGLSIGRIQGLDTKIGFETLSGLKYLRFLDLTGPRLPLLYVKGVIGQLPVLHGLRLNEHGSFCLDEIPLDSGFETLPRILTTCEGDGDTAILYGLKRLEVRSSLGAFHPLVSIASTSPILEYIVIKGEYDARNPTKVLENVREMAKALGQSCSRLQDLFLETKVIGPTAFDYDIKLRGFLTTAVAASTVAMDFSSGGLLSPWVALRSLHVRGHSKGEEGGLDFNMILLAVWDGRQVFQETLEELVIPYESYSNYYVTEVAVDILCMFKNLRIFDIGKETLLIHHLFTGGSIPARGMSEGGAIEAMEGEIRPWACQDLENMSLTLAHEDLDSNWCPDDLDQAEVDKHDIMGLKTLFAEGYPVFIAIKQFLCRFPKLDQKNVVFNR